MGSNRLRRGHRRGGRRGIFTKLKYGKRQVGQIWHGVDIIFMSYEKLIKNQTIIHNIQLSKAAGTKTAINTMPKFSAGLITTIWGA